MAMTPKEIHYTTIAAGAVVGAALLPVAAPAALGVLGLGAIASALGITSVSAGVGALLGGYVGHVASNPTTSST